MFELTVNTTFSAAHSLKGYPGDCRHIHGHNWQAAVCLRGEQLDELGLCMDFREIKRRIHSVTSELDHRLINDLQPFDRLNPSSENLARHLFCKIREEFADTPVNVVRVTVSESPDVSAAYFENQS